MATLSVCIGSSCHLKGSYQIIDLMKKALEENGWLSGVIQNEAMMSPEEKMIYEIFGGRDTIIKNLLI